MPSISIIIPTWNTSQVTAKCIASIQQYLPSNFYELIVVDNASTDDTAKALKKYSNIKYVYSSKNLGFARGNNLGAKHATAPYLLFLNSDMELIDNSLLIMFSFLKKHSEIGLIGPQFLNPDFSPQASVFPPQSALNAFKEFFLNQNTYSKFLPSNTCSVWAISGGAVLISRRLFDQIGAWNEKYFMYYEDLDLCRSIRQRGYQIYYYPKCRLIHRHGWSGRKLADYQNQWRRLIPGSIRYHGLIKHYILFLIIKFGQKWQHLKT